MKIYVHRIIPATLVAATAAGILLTATPPALVLAAENATCTAEATKATLTAEVDGNVIHLEGTNWCHPEEGGSHIAVKFDGGTWSRETPVHSNATVWQVIEANDDGSFSADVVLPDTTAESASTGEKRFAEGAHSVTLLSGSIKDGDSGRSLTSDFYYGERPPIEVTSEDKTVSLRSQAEATSGGTLELHGEGWTTADKSAGAQVVLKLNALKDDGTLTRYTQSGDNIENHPGTGNPDPTIWAIVTADEDGSFDTTITLPTGLVAGQYFEVAASTGLRAGDPQRDLGTGPLVVEGKEYVAPEPGETTQCAASESVTVTVDESLSTATSVHIDGTGWCNTVAGASKVAVKIDEGNFSRSKPIETNATIWFLIDPDPATGNFSADIPLPNTSDEYASPQSFGTGQHTLTLLTGSLKQGDPVRSKSVSFVVGEYRPNGIPDPLNYEEDLTEAAAGTVTVTPSGNQLLVSVPDGTPGDWVYLTLYNEGGTPNSFWGDKWYQLDDNRQFAVSLSGLSMPAQNWKAVVQSGNKDSQGELVGWDYYESPEALNPEDLTVELDGLAAAIRELDNAVTGGTSTTSAAPSTSARPAGTTGNSATNSNQEPTVIRRTISASNSGSGSTATGSTGTNGANTATGQPKPENTPELPVKRYADLKEGNSGDLKVTVDGELLTITAEQASPNDWVYLRIYTLNGPVDVGWVQVDKDKSVRLDTSSVPDGEYRVTMQNKDGQMLGWVALSLAAATEDAADAGASDGQPVQRQVQASVVPIDTRAMVATDWWLLAIGTLVPVLSAGAIAWWRRLVNSPQSPAVDDDPETTQVFPSVKE